MQVAHVMFPVLGKANDVVDEQFNSFVAFETSKMMNSNQPGEEASPCGITVHSHSPSWLHTAVRGIESLSRAHWNKPLTKCVVLNILESPSSERRSSTTGSGRTGIMFCSLIFL